MHGERGQACRADRSFYHDLVRAHLRPASVPLPKESPLGPPMPEGHGLNAEQRIGANMPAARVTNVLGGMGALWNCVTPRLDARNVLSLQRMASHVRIDERLVDYAVRLVRASRAWPGLAGGASPRGTIAIVRAARAAALFAARDAVTADDIKQAAPHALRHRVRLAADTQFDGRPLAEVLAAMLDSVEAPRV